MTISETFCIFFHTKPLQSSGSFILTPHLKLLPHLEFSVDTWLLATTLNSPVLRDLGHQREEGLFCLWFCAAGL